MSALLPDHDSDEEVFFGPITARELELDWKRLKAKKLRAIMTSQREEAMNTNTNTLNNNPPNSNNVSKDSLANVESVVRSSDENLSNESSVISKVVELQSSSLLLAPIGDPSNVALSGKRDLEKNEENINGVSEVAERKRSSLLLTPDGNPTTDTVSDNGRHLGMDEENMDDVPPETTDGAELKGSSLLLTPDGNPTTDTVSDNGRHLRMDEENMDDVPPETTDVAELKGSSLLLTPDGNPTTVTLSDNGRHLGMDEENMEDVPPETTHVAELKGSSSALTPDDSPTTVTSSDNGRNSEMDEENKNYVLPETSDVVEIKDSSLLLTPDGNLDLETTEENVNNVLPVTSDVVEQLSSSVITPVVTSTEETNKLKDIMKAEPVINIERNNDAEEQAGSSSCSPNKENFDAVKCEVGIKSIKAAGDLVENNLRESTFSGKSIISLNAEKPCNVSISLTPLHKKIHSMEATVTTMSDRFINDSTDFVEINLKSEIMEKSLLSDENQCSSAPGVQGSKDQRIYEANTSNMNPSNMELPQYTDEIVRDDPIAISNVSQQNIMLTVGLKENMDVDSESPLNNETSNKIIEQGHSSFGENVNEAKELLTNEVSNLSFETEETTAKLVEELKTKVEAMDFNDSNIKEVPLENVCSYSTLNNSVPSAPHSETGIPISYPEVSSSGLEEKSKEQDNDASDLSYASLPGEKENDGYNRVQEVEAYVPPDKKQKCNVFTPNCKENEDPQDCTVQKSKIPVSGSSKLPILKPPTLKVERFVKDSVWASEFKMKKIPKPKKPDYVVSPAKLDNLLKSKLDRPRSASSLYQKPSSTPLQRNNSLFNTPKPMSKPSTAPTPEAKATPLKTPVTLRKIPVKMKTEPQSPIKTPPKTLKYKNIASPIADYINKSKTVIIRNVTPSTSNKPILRMSNGSSITTESGNIKARPKVASTPDLSPKFYASANKVLLQSSPKTSPVLPKLGEKQATVFRTPQPQVFRHLGRVKSEEKKPGQCVAVPKPGRNTSVSETSFANLPLSKSNDCDVSVLERQ